MKLFGALMIISILSAGQIYSQSVGLGNTDPTIFSKFRIPSTQVRRFDIGGTANLSSGRESMPGMSVNRQTYSLNISPYYLYADESEKRQFRFEGNFNGGFGGYNADETYNSPNTVTTDNSSRSGYLSLSPALSVYTSEMNSIFYRLNGNIQVDMYENTTKQKSPVQPERINASGGKTQRYSASAGIGWGRLRDVTSVVNAIRFQERLKVLNKISADMSEDDILALSSQFARFSSYTQTYERSGKYFYKDLNDILVNRNINLGDLNLFASSYLMETLQELKFQRIEGVEAGVNVSLNYVNSYNMSEYQPNPRSSSLAETFNTALNLFAGYSHQLDLYSQLYIYANISGGPNVINHPDVRQIYSFSLNTAYSRELTDRFLFTASDNAQYTMRNSDLESLGLFNNLRLKLNYFIEDNITLNLEYSWMFNENKYKTVPFLQQIPEDGRSLSSTHSVWFGINYILQNSLNIF